MLPRQLTKKERSTAIYFPPACKNGRHWQICKKIVPSFMIAGAEHSGANVLYEARPVSVLVQEGGLMFLTLAIVSVLKYKASSHVIFG